MNSGLEPGDEAVAVRPSSIDWPAVVAGLRWGLIFGYMLVLTLSIAEYGVPIDRAGITLWALAAVGVMSIGRPWRSVLRALLDWLPFTLVLFLYDYTRGLADTLGMPVHYREPIVADEAMFGVVPTYWLQQHFYVPGQTNWYDAVVAATYLSHFLATPVIAVLLWARNRKRFYAWVGCWLALAIAGVTTYVLYPMAPPWLASDMGLMREVDRISGAGWHYLGIGVADRALQVGQDWSNAVAAMPSLHTGYAALIAFFFMVKAPWWRRVLLACYPLLMGLALVYSGEHYVIDVIAGIAYAAAIVACWRLIHHWRKRRSMLTTTTTDETERVDLETPIIIRSDEILEEQCASR